MDEVFRTVAKALRVPVGKVRAYLEKAKERVKARAAVPEPIRSRERFQTIKAGPRLRPAIERLATIKETSSAEAAQAEAPRRELDDLYEKWVAASPEERPAVLEQMDKPASKLGLAVRYTELHENDPDFPNDVAGAILQRVPHFDGRNNAKFSSYAYSIAKKKATEWKRKRGRYKKIFPVSADDERHSEKFGSTEAASMADTRLLMADLSKGLSPEDRVLLELMCEGRKPPEIAEMLKITQDAAESRRRRLRDRLSKKIKIE